MGLSKNSKKSARMLTKKHIRKRVLGTPQKPRLVVFKSLKHIYAQLVDDTNLKTITGVSSLTKDLQAEIGKAKTKTDKAKLVGKKIADMAKEKKFESVVFDRNGYLYHGRVKAVAEGAKEGGLKF